MCLDNFQHSNCEKSSIVKKIRRQKIAAEKGRGRRVFLRGARGWGDGCKPDSVRRAACAAAWTAICLSAVFRRTLALAGCDQYPGTPTLARREGRRPAVPCSVLHHTGFFVPPRLRSGRWALTPPFQPCRPACAVLGGMFSATLSVGRGLGPRPPACSTRRVAMRCPDFPPPASGGRPSAIGKKTKPIPNAVKPRIRGRSGVFVKRAGATRAA